MEDKTTRKVTAGETTKTEKVVKGLGPALADLVKKPGVIVTLLGAAGYVGPEVAQTANKLLEMDLPGWALLVLVGAYVLVRMGHDALKTLRELTKEFREFREETRTRLKNGDGILKEYRGRLDYLEAWKEAHDPHWKQPGDETPAHD